MIVPDDSFFLVSEKAGQCLGHPGEMRHLWDFIKIHLRLIDESGFWFRAISLFGSMLYALGKRNAGEITDKRKSFAWCGMVMHGLACMACMVLSSIDIKSIKVILSDCLDIHIEWKSEEKSKNLNKICNSKKRDVPPDSFFSDTEQETYHRRDNCLCRHQCWQTEG